MKYALVTPARNEEALIGRLLESMVSQTVLPERWIIVDDGSTDKTAEIVEPYARRYHWIKLLRRSHRKERNFAGKVHAFNAGLKELQDLSIEVVGNLDADISFSADHFEFLMNQFALDPKLGVAGTAYTEDKWDSTRDSFEGETSVHGACQIFRYECFLDIGGYSPNPAGGIDWIATTTARMKGWKTRNFSARRFHHYRKMGTAQRGQLGAMFDYGMKDYFLGGSPLWEVARVVYRMGKSPIVLGGAALLLGYSWAAIRRVKRPVSPELMHFHRSEQLRKLKMIAMSLLKFRKIEPYLIGSEK